MDFWELNSCVTGFGMNKVGNAITKTGSINHSHFHVKFHLQHINDLSLQTELDTTVSKAEAIYQQLILAVQVPDVCKKDC
jgi:hypothetical protein